MKQSVLIYLLSLIILFTAIISGKRTISKMKESGQHVDRILLSLDSLNRKQADIFLLLGNDIPHHSPLNTRDTVISFSSLNIYKRYQAEMESINNTYLTDIDSLSAIFDSSVTNRLASYPARTDSIIQSYNMQARIHNSYIKGFPRNFYSSLFGFQAKAYFEQ